MSEEEGCGSPECTVHLTWRTEGLPEWGWGPGSIKELRHFKGGHGLIPHDPEAPRAVFLHGRIRRPVGD